MAIKKTGPISFQDIVNEFGGTAPHGLNEYYQGGANVPITPINDKVPKTGKISLGDFYGAQAVVTFDFLWQGAGGTGGRGFENQGNPGTYSQAGRQTGIMTKAKYDSLLTTSGTLPASIAASNFISYAAGGAGGLSGDAGLGIRGEAGEASDYGDGAAGGALNGAGASAALANYGAGGAGGGGDDGSSSWFGWGGDRAGAAGRGGKKGAKTTGTLTLDPGEYVILLGGAGANDTVGNHNGGYGAPGYAEITLPGQTTQTFVNTNAATNRFAWHAHFITL